MTGLVEMRNLGFPIVMDASHSVQLPGMGGGKSAGRREMIPPLARAAAAVGIDGLFLEVHPEPDSALCDGPNSLRLDNLETLLKQVQAILKTHSF
jgi:2-dehydro-3-deoxyphosphooctonate aldolase (KDO 8-P synthase)